MIARIVAFALNQRFVTLALALLLTAAGIVSFRRLPIEAYPDVADVEVDVITLWPGHAAAAPDRRGRRVADRRADRVRGARQGVPARARRGRPVASREVSGGDLAGGRRPLRPRDPRAAARVPRGPHGRVAARSARRRHRS